MKVLVIGSGGREHALAWRLARSESVTAVYAIPGNPGIAQVATCLPATDLAPVTLLRAATELGVDLTVVGPEAPLVEGVVDTFRSAGLRIVGPTQRNARLEGSKIYAKSFFAQHGIPTAAYHAVATPPEAAKALDGSRYPVVIKADGLAAGKGVVIANDRAAAEAAVVSLGPQLVIEEHLEGEEVSFIVLSDGRDVVPLEPCQDHKRIFDGDQGPNTGGMGAYCDSRILDASARETILRTIIRPTVDATGFTGFLYAGLMMTADGPKLLEFNVRLGDPETQPILYRLGGDFGQLLLAAAESRLRDTAPEWSPEPAVCVVMAAEGYPGKVVTGAPIVGIEGAESVGTTVFQAGTQLANGGLTTAGGRVLGVAARAPDLGAAVENAYRGVYRIAFRGMQFRHDIGSKGLSRWADAPLE